MTILLPYQGNLWRLLDKNPVVICEKSRRIGMTWAAAAYAVLHAAKTANQGGSDVLYIGYNLEMTTEFLAAAQQWIVAIQASSVQLVSGQKSEISRTRITFLSGHSIKALSSRPRSLRGRQGLVIIDEAAFHEDLEGLMKAAMALLIWQGKLLVISTHFGRGNAFYRLIEAIKAGKYDYAHLKVTFNDALRDGLYKRIAAIKNLSTSMDAQKIWADRIRADYGEAAIEELDCIPSSHVGQYIPREILERATDANVAILRYRHSDVTDRDQWVADVFLPCLCMLSPTERSVIGVDFGRHHDLSVFYLLQIGEDLRRHSRLIIELDATPFEDQWHILHLLLQRCPKLSQVMMDKGGIGGYLHEKAADHFGNSLIQGIQLSQSWYGDYMPKLKAAFENQTITLPQDAIIIEDLCQIRVVANIPRPVGRKNNRHADSAIALCLAYQASEMDGIADYGSALVGAARQFNAENIGF